MPHGRYRPFEDTRLPSYQLTIRWVFAIVRRIKFNFCSFFAPYPFPSPLRILSIVSVPFRKVPVYGLARSVHRRVVAAMNDGSRHTAEDRFNYV